MERNISRLPTHHYGQVLGFVYKPSYLTRLPKLLLNFTNVTSGSANVLRSKVAANARLLSLSYHILLVFSIEIPHYLSSSKDDSFSWYVSQIFKVLAEKVV